ncbi:MAG: Na+/H+ antiporter NhaC family protein [Lachnospiraceae bacterium]|nr:Na+/H+ antiporter NhaC family protein [Lachnospiraceae bacterium]
MDTLQLILSILPPVIAIGLALITKEVISSLLVGILAGTLIYSQGNVVGMVTATFELMGSKIGDNVNILIFLGLLGALVVIVTRAGGSAAYGDWASRKITTRRGAALATSALGCLIFIDDYFNCLSVGTVMRPVTDKHRISRAKLAYLLDATAAPICIIAPVSSWGASVASYMSDATGMNGMTTFVKTIPYNFYAILTIIMILVICLTKLNYGPMAKFEKNAIEKGDLFTNRENVVTDDLGGNTGKALKGKVYDLIIPIIALIVCTVLAMVYTGGGFSGTPFLSSFGECDSAFSLVLGSFLALVVTFILYIPRKVLNFVDFMGGITEGIKSMVPAFTILILAWTIGGVCSEDYLQTGRLVGDAISNSAFPTFLLPAVIMIVAAFLGFSTGTSWGTMAILIPIGAAIASTPNTQHLLLPIFGCILGGAVFGDHVSPISDTTILSSTGAGCNHIDHVSSQMYYASTVLVCCLVGHVLMGLMGGNLVVPLVVSIALLLAVLFALNKTSEKKETIDYSNVKH